MGNGPNSVQDARSCRTRVAERSATAPPAASSSRWQGRPEDSEEDSNDEQEQASRGSAGIIGRKPSLAGDMSLLSRMIQKDPAWKAAALRAESDDVQNVSEDEIADLDDL